MYTISCDHVRSCDVCNRVTTVVSHLHIESDAFNFRSTLGRFMVGTGGAHIRPPAAQVSLLENSKILGDQNILYVKQLLQPAGFDVLDFRTDAADYGSPSRRERQYLLIVLADGAVGLAPPWAPRFLSVLSSMRVGHGDPYMYIYPATHPQYIEWHSTLCVSRETLEATRSAAAKKRKVCVWTPPHG